MADRIKYNIAIVAPVHVPVSKEWVKSLESITAGKRNVKVIIVYDEWRHIELGEPAVELSESFDVYGYDRQREELGDEMYERFKKFHKSSAIKNFGHWLAWRDGYDIVIGLDSDCIVPPNFIAEHLDGLLRVSNGWTNPLDGSGWFPRGFPYHQRVVRTIASLGLWNKELDLYGRDRLDNPSQQTSSLGIRQYLHEVADGYVPFSGMNWAMWSEAIPAMFFLPNFEYKHGEKLFKFRRHDDIWGGYIFQRLMALRGDRMVYGLPIVSHDTIVDAEKDAAEEEGMIAFEKPFYDAVDYIFSSKPMEWGMYFDVFQKFVEYIEDEWKGTEFDPLIEAMKFWSDLFDRTDREI